MVVGDGFEPSKTWSVDLQSTAFGRSAIPPLERVKGIEPSQSAWKADVLPLNYTRLSVFVNIQQKIEKSSRKKFFFDFFLIFSIFLPKKNYFIIDIEFSENDDIVLVCDYFVSKKGNMKNDPYRKSS